MSFARGCVLVMDLGYVDYAWMDVLDSIKNVEYEFLTIAWKPATVEALYKERWEIETCFKHLKQRLKITGFVGTSENAVYIQIWTAPIGILLL